MAWRLSAYRFFIALASALLVCAAANAQVTLVEGGQAHATIVISDQPTDQAVEAAEVLQDYLERISGAELPIAHESNDVSGVRILVGRSATVEALDLEIPSGRTHANRDEGFVIKTLGDALVLAGNEDWNYQGTLFAVYDFLERDLGCRWYFPGEFGELLPSMDTIAVSDLDRTERPDFPIRCIGYAGWMPISDEDQRLFDGWCVRHKLTGLSVDMPGDGSIKRLAPPEVYLESHPEMFSRNRHGERWEGMHCTTDPEARAVSAAAIKDYFREHPEVWSFGFAPGDTYSPVCHCENCMRALQGFSGKGIGNPSISELWFSFANDIAKEVYKEFPDRWVLTNGYANRVRLPESIPELSPNLGIQLATIHICTLHRIGDPRCWSRQVYQRILDRWTDATDFVLIYDYDPGSALDNLPYPGLHTLKHDMPYFKERGIAGFWTHAANAWTVTHLNYYVRAKMMWNTTANVDELVRDYCERFYGPAAGPVEQYMWLLEGALEDTNIHTAWGDVIPWGAILAPVLDDLDRLMEEMHAKAEEEPYAGRVRVPEIAHEHMLAYLSMERAIDDADFGKAVEWCDRMLELRDVMGEVHSGFLPHTAEFAKDFRTATEWHRTLYQDLADKAGGDQGELVANLPRTWEFKEDPKDMGVIFQWYLPEYEDGWQPIDTTLYWEAQGHADDTGWGYWGKAWYRTQFDVPADAEDKPLTLTLGGVYHDNANSPGFWVWVNGRLLERERCRYHPMGGLVGLKPIHIDVTGEIRAGQENRIAVLVETGPPERWPRSGIHRRSFLWRPRGHGE